MTAALLLALALGSAPVDFSQVRELSLAGDHEAAQQAAAELRASPAFAAADEPSRARALFAIGVAQYRAEAPEEALSAFLDARDLAGAGKCRLDAMYDIGTVLLERAEAVRATIPEIAGASGSPPAVAPGMGAAPGPGAPPAPGGPLGAPASADQPQGPDPLETARAAYLGAREALLDRLRTARPDADTRANLELAVRRLRELDEIQRKREEEQQQQQEQQDEQQQDKQSPSDDSESKPSDDDSQQQDQQDQQDKKDQQDQPPEDQQGSQDPEQQDQDQQQPQDQDQHEEFPPEDGQQDEDSGDESQQQPQPQDGEQELMSAEEIQRLMDRLREIEEQARAVQAMLRQRERVPVEKDW